MGKKGIAKKKTFNNKNQALILLCFIFLPYTLSALA